MGDRQLRLSVGAKMDKQPDSPIQHNFAKQMWQPIHLIIALKLLARLISLFFSLSSFFLVFKSNSAELFPLLCPNYYFSCYLHLFLVLLNVSWRLGATTFGLLPNFSSERRVLLGGKNQWCGCTVLCCWAAVQLHFTLPKCFGLHRSWNIDRFSLSCTTIFSFSPSFDCRIERQNFQIYRVTLYVLTN